MDQYITIGMRDESMIERNPDAGHDDVITGSEAMNVITMNDPEYRWFTVY